MNKKVILIIFIIFIVIFLLLYFKMYKINIININEFKKVLGNIDNLKINIIYSDVSNGNKKTICNITDKEDIKYMYNVIIRKKGKKINKKESIIGGSYYFHINNIENNNTVDFNINQNQLNVGNELYEVDENLTLLMKEIYEKYKNDKELI